MPWPTSGLFSKTTKRWVALAWMSCDTMRRPGFAANRLAFNPGHAIYCKFLNPVEPRFPHIYSDCNNTYYTGYCGN